MVGNLAEINYLKIIDWSPLVNNFQNLSIESFVTYPRFALFEGIKELINGNVNGDVLATNPDATVITLVGVAEVAWLAPVAFVVFAEHIADHKNLSSIVGRDLLKEPGLSRTYWAMVLVLSSARHLVFVQIHIWRISRLRCHHKKCFC